VNSLTEIQIEQLACLAEEAAEVAQAAMKVLRHGYRSTHPSCITGFDNRDSLMKELGDLRAIVAIMVQAKEFTISEYQHFAIQKLTNVQQYLHHQENKDLAQACLDIHNAHG
jgi:NTP pyrophosphatase (non-canonical NTP hydrolase)